ncbi:efflux transporter outer membrane subunit [Desulfovibrio legallii]|uniref:Outer membrane protein, Cu(I)/Ag(I) efflux system n=1 Tax=Desulfovibrio legallii TaxID=571438 RepID=A0A1G7PA28_9BACT|nr:efflux transporter outer membrane subunit [Desulfovibrio legallii]SDF83138.1 outer membrane protein, Cu(I)/Ag(I) efflux system [Desulfovibrio legallii]
MDTPRVNVALALVLAFWLSACSLAPDYQRPAAPMPSAVTEAGYGPDAAARAPGQTVDITAPGWRDFFKDAQLQALLDEGLRRNRDLKLAVLAVAEARAQYGVQRAERLPQLSLDGSDTVSGSFYDQPKDKFAPMLTIPAFELDFFGRVKNLSGAALERYLASEEAARAAQISLVAQIAQSWADLRLAKESLQLARKTVQSWEASYAFMGNRLRSGQASVLELEQARGAAASARAALAQQEQEAVRAANALSLLLGSFEKRDLPPAAPLAEQATAPLPESLSSSVLLRRPDVLEAEHNLKAANADIGAARAAFFPIISLTGSAGYASGALASLFDGAASVWTFVPRLVLPIFTAGRNKANLDLAEVRKESSVTTYEKTLQTAFREVADALMTRRYYAGQLAAQQEYLAAQRRVLALASGRYASGTISYLEVLDAQRTVYAAEQALLTIRRNQLVNDSNLYAALGGGLAAQTAAPAARP